MSRRKDRKRRRDTFSEPPAGLPRPEVYALSAKFGPPQVDLRQAELLDGYGESEYAQRHVSHGRPWDVSRADLDYYPRVFAFMTETPADLLFYLWPVAYHFAADPALEASESFLFNFDDRIGDLWPALTEPDRAAAVEGLRWIREADPYDSEFWGCPHLTALLDPS